MSTYRYSSKDGNTANLTPGKAGFLLPLTQYRTLAMLISDIKTAIPLEGRQSTAGAKPDIGGLILAKFNASVSSSFA